MGFASARSDGMHAALGSRGCAGWQERRRAFGSDLEGEIAEDPLDGGRPLRIAMLAPPWIPVPAPAYGGIEEVVRLLCAGLAARGHDVTLFAAPGSSSPATVVPVLQAAHPDEMSARSEADHVARAFDAIDAAAGHGAPYDVIHDHVAHTALAMADRVGVPVVHTLHGAFDEEARAFYAPRRQGLHRGDLACPARRGPAGDGRRARGPQPDRLRRVAVPRGQGRLPAVGGAHVARQGAAARDRRGVRGRRAAGPRRAGPARPGGVLRGVGRAAARP